jgi:hypothetical protein
VLKLIVVDSRLCSVIFRINNQSIHSDFLFTIGKLRFFEIILVDSVQF